MVAVEKTQTVLTWPGVASNMQVGKMLNALMQRCIDDLYFAIIQ